MRTSLIIASFGSLIALALPGPAAATESGSPAALSLDEAIRLGLERNPAMAAAIAGTEAARQDRLAAEAGRWPRLTAEADWRHTDNPVLVFGDKLTAGVFTQSDFALDSLNDPDPESHLTAALAMEVPLYTSGRLRWGIESARRGEEAARARLSAARADLIARITEGYFSIESARAAVRVAEMALSDARGHEAVASSRFEAGAALKSDLLKARVFRLGRERELDRSRADLAVVTSRLGRLIGLAPGELPEPTTPLETPDAALGSLDAWIQRAMSGSLEIEASRIAAGAAGAAARAARASRGPELAGFARYARDADEIGSGEGSYLVGVGLRWAAFDRSRAARVAAAEADRASAEAASREAADAVRLEVERAFHDAMVAERGLAVSREAVAAAQAAQRIASDRYAGGLLEITHLLDAQTDLVSARLSEVTTMYEIVVSRARLERAAGSLEVPQ